MTTTLPLPSQSSATCSTHARTVKGTHVRSLTCGAYAFAQVTPETAQGARCCWQPSELPRRW